jgi:UDP-2,3-diacylglucosamine pyrophosphatase LpxH
MSRPVLPVFLPAVMVAILVGLWPAYAAVADESIGVLESFDSKYVGEWRIDGRTYVVETRATIPVAGPLPPAGAESPVPGQLVRVKYDVRDGVRYITWMQLLGIGPESVQDGPHLIWSDDDSATMITVVDGKVIRSVHDGISDGDELSTPSRTIPAIRIGSTVAPPASSWPDATRILAVSDLEGNRETFLAFLQGNGVVNEAGEWIWGDGHLVLNGDIVDRGEQVTELLWMIRRLEREAVRAGGRVHYVLGNHESMVMAGDLRYIHPKYRFTTDRIGASYDDLHGPNSELGRWLRNHNSVIRVGPFLFVHAGYSPELDRLGLELDEINRTIRVGLGPPAWPTAAKADLRTGLIWHQQGPHWYRGYFPRHAADWGGRPSEEMIASILNRHGVKHIVVGHTVVDEVGRIDGRPELIGIDVAWRDPSEAAGLLLAEGRLYQVDASGQKTPLDSGQSPTSGE